MIEWAIASLESLKIRSLNLKLKSHNFRIQTEMSALKLPEGSLTLSLLQKLQWITKPLEILETHAQTYGDIFTFPVGPSGIPQVVISNPQGIQKIFTADLKKIGFW